MCWLLVFFAKFAMYLVTFRENKTLTFLLYAVSYCISAADVVFTMKKRERIGFSLLFLLANVSITRYPNQNASSHHACHKFATSLRKLAAI